jgi:hypothetical protein
MESKKHHPMVRIVPDAVVGAGMVLRAGEIVPAHTLGDHLEPLLQSGAVEWESGDSESVTLR